MKRVIRIVFLLVLITLAYIVIGRAESIEQVEIVEKEESLKGAISNIQENETDNSAPPNFSRINYLL